MGVPALLSASSGFTTYEYTSRSIRVVYSPAPVSQQFFAKKQKVLVDDTIYPDFVLQNKRKEAFDELTISGFSTSSSGTSRVAIRPVFLRRVVRGLLGDCGSDRGGRTGAISSALLTAKTPSLSSWSKEKSFHKP